MSSLSNSSSVISANLDIESPLNGWSDDSGLNYAPVIATSWGSFLMLQTLLTKNAACREQNDKSPSFDDVTTSCMIGAMVVLNCQPFTTTVFTSLDDMLKAKAISA